MATGSDTATAGGVVAADQGQSERPMILSGHEKTRKTQGFAGSRSGQIGTLAPPAGERRLAWNTAKTVSIVASIIDQWSDSGQQENAESLAREIIANIVASD